VLDASGKPVAKALVLAIQKRWPNNRYRQDALATTTNKDGHFRFDNFATGGSQYAFLLTVVAEGYAMESEYRLVQDGSQQESVTLMLDEAAPVTFVFQDAARKPIEGVEASPSERTAADSTDHLNYSMHFKSYSKRSDKNGEAAFTAWKPGESGSVNCRWRDQFDELRFQVGDDRRVILTLPRMP
jgi:hypothetical protein